MPCHSESLLSLRTGLPATRFPEAEELTVRVSSCSTVRVKGCAKSARGGPQYPCVLPLGDALWIFYSIGKEQVGAPRVPFASLGAAIPEPKGA